MPNYKCQYCKQEIKGSDNYYIDSSGKRNVYYCNKEHFQLQKDKIKYKPKKELPTGEPNPRRDLLDYIQEIYVENGYDKHFINWKLITSIIKNQMEENKDMKYTGMKYCLWYMKEIANVNLFDEQSNTIISLLPFYYEESKQYYIQSKEISDMVDEFKFEDETIVINKSVDKNRNMRYNEINMEEL